MTVASTSKTKLLLAAVLATGLAASGCNRSSSSSAAVSDAGVASGAASDVGPGPVDTTPASSAGAGG
jgi:hypothetical protein